MRKETPKGILRPSLQRAHGHPNSHILTVRLSRQEARFTGQGSGHRVLTGGAAQGWQGAEMGTVSLSVYLGSPEPLPLGPW